MTGRAVKAIHLRLILLAALGSAWIGPPPAEARRQPARAFQPAACMFSLPVGAQEGRDVECGWLTVPEEHARPDGPSLRLGVAIVKSRSPNPAPDPLVMLQGGPGGSTIDLFSQVLFNNSPLRANRDIILFDQRGTLYAEPDLLCEELFDLGIDLLDDWLSVEEGERRSLAAAADCRDRLRAEGVRLEAFDSLENAADIEALRAALGYEQINLYGVSYGTTLALHAMREHPAGLRSVILDSVAPLQWNFIEHVPLSMQRAFDELFRACARDPACDRAYPDLETVFFGLVAEWNREPARFTLRDAGRDYDALFDGTSLINVLFQLLYSTEVIPALPKTIYDLRDGDYGLLQIVWPQIAFDRTFSTGMYNSVICAEDADFDPAGVPLDGVRPEIVDYADSTPAYFAELCADWEVPALPARVDEPVVSDIPTLIFGGQFDPITPPANGELVAETLSRAYVVTFPTTGHGSALGGACPAEILNAFLDNPAAAPDTGCIDESPAVRFITPETAVLTPTVYRWISSPGAADLGGFGLALICLPGLLTAFLIWPIAFVARLLRGRAAPAPPLPSRLGRYAAILLSLLAGLCAAVFVVGLIVAVGGLVASFDLLILFGLPGWTRPLFALPLMVAGAGAVMLVAFALSWFDRTWSTPARLYYAALGFCALGCALAFGLWGFLWIG